MKNLALLTIPLIARLLPSSARYVWPDDKIDEIEDLLYLQKGYNARNFSDPITPCTKGVDNVGSNTGAEWIRIAFHDAASYNATDRSGGLDASVMWELKYKNNDGAGFNHTFDLMQPHYTMRSSMSDLFAVATYAAMRGCGGIAVPIKAGRIDAKKGFPADIGPTPFDSGELLASKFAIMGFSVPDMIKLTACGHTMGGIHGKDLPPVLANDTVGNYVPFDSSVATFDNKIVTEFLDGTSQSPLVAGKDSTNSDKGVFEMDGNVTMKAIADKDAFNAACVDVLGRMIDSVPKEVVLSEVITPIEVKPAVTLQVGSTGLLEFSGTIRVHNVGAKDLTKTMDHVVSLQYVDENKKPVAAKIPTKHVGSASGFDDSFEFYSFTYTLTKAGIHHFDVIVDGKLYTNNDEHYEIHDNVLLQRTQSCITASPDANGNYTIKAVAAIKKVAPTSVTSKAASASSAASSAAAPASSAMATMNKRDMAMPKPGVPMLAIAYRIPQVAVYSAVVPTLSMTGYDMTPMDTPSFAKDSGYTFWTSTHSLAADQIPTVIDLMTTTESLIFIKTKSLAICK